MKLVADLEVSVRNGVIWKTHLFLILGISFLEAGACSLLLSMRTG